MDILKFSLKGKTAFFKKPALNSYYSFTYGNIHKVALLGMLGAIRGYSGYASMDINNEDFPEFYMKLKEIRCAIVPKNDAGFTKKKIQQFNNSVGYASEEQGGNLIVKEQWLENPFWDIYIALDCEEARKLADDLLQHKCAYIPYLGKNDHPADIVEVEPLKNCEPVTSFFKIDSLCFKEKIRYGDMEDYEEKYEGMKEFKYEEQLPVALNKDTQMYEYSTFVHSNLPIESYEGQVYQPAKETIVFF
jgi:CRISPR-associated protein Cas5, subtype I-B/HMARI